MKTPAPQRLEHDSMGDIAVNADALWGAQTQRSLHHFAISTERMPQALLYALARTKRAAARVNHELGLLDATVSGAIAQAADEVLAGKHPDAFPLAVWQTTDKSLTCYCRTLYMTVWETHKPGKIRMCDAPEQVRLAAEAKEA